jgi:hypothetical protein
MFARHFHLQFGKVALCLWLVSLLAARADLQRQANTTLTLPAELQAPTYTTQNAIPGTTFANPMCTAFPAGETNRLYVAERAGIIQVVNDLSAVSPAKVSFMNLTTYLNGQQTPLTTNGENGLLSMVFHPNYNQNGYFYLYFSVSINGQPHQRLARFRATGTAGNYNAAASANASTQAPLLTI